MRRFIPLGGTVALALAFALTTAVPAVARAIAVMPNRTATQQAMQAEVIVVGKVAEIEKEMSKATQFPGAKDKVDYHVGVIKINESVLGAKGLTTVRVGYLPAPKFAPVDPNQPIRPRPPIGRFPVATLAEGQEGAFFLSKHHDGDFYIMQQWGVPLDKKVADFSKQLDSVKKIVKTVDDPMAALKATDEADRRFAAAVLIQRYRSVPPNVGGKQPKQEDIPADQSKLIMEIIAGMEWNKYEQKEGIAVSANNMFGMLGIQQGQHGFTPPKFMKGQQDYAKVYADYIQKWIKDNADKYRIQKWVVSN